MSVETPAGFDAIAAKVKPYADDLIARYPDARSALIPLLHRFQEELGWISPEAMTQTGAWLGLPLAVIESTASFYSLLYRRPIGRYMLQPCRNLPCLLNGAEEVMARFRNQLGISHLETTDDGLFSYEEVECLAACDRAPCMQVNLEFVYDLTPEKVDLLVAAIRNGMYAIPPLPQTTKPGKSWHVEAEAVRKAPGARDVPDPDDPGGIGDRVGAAMLRRLVSDPAPVRARPTNERAVREAAEIVVVENGASEAH